MNTIYETAYELAPPRLEYDPAMDHPEPKPTRKPLPFEMVRTGDGSKAYRMEGRTIITHRSTWIKYAMILMMGKHSREPHLTCDRRDVAKLLKFYRKEAASC
jgi:hypothetical protein